MSQPAALRVFLTEAEARKAIAAIDAARAPSGTERLRGPDGVEYDAPVKPWAVPVRLRDGTFGVPFKPRLRPIEGRVVDVRGEAVAVIRESDCVTKTDADREAVVEADPKVR